MSALSRCSKPQQDDFFSLHNCFGDALPPALGIFETNALPCGENDVHGDIAMKGGLFLIGSRFNSSCTPNVNNHWDEKNGKEVFRAIRDIEKGEEMCIGCEACLLTGKELEESDARRETIELIMTAHSARLSSFNPLEAIGEVAIALKCINEEKLFAYQSTFYFFGFHICAAVSDFKNARLWARKAYEASSLIFNNEASKSIKRYAEDPTAYSEAGTLSKRTLAGPDSLAWAFLGFTKES
ncbi:SET domain-containing protein [Abortiporus biennis]